MKIKRFIQRGGILLALSFILSHTVQAQNWQALGGGTGWGYSLCTYNNELYAGGNFGILKWNGVNWASVGGGVVGGVNAMAVYNGRLYAGGTLVQAGTIPVSYIAAWDGVSWADPEGGVDSYVAALTTWNGLLIVGGYFTVANVVTVNHIASWDDLQWAALGSGTGGTQGQVMALSTYNGEVIAAGFFTSAGGNPANHIAKWNGTSWSTLGSGIAWITYALTPYNGSLIAGGLFSQAGGIPANDVASWNGTSWSALGAGVGGGLYGYCLALAVHGNELCAAGMYTTAGGNPAGCIALWNGTSWFSNMNGGMFNSGSTIAVNAVIEYGNGFVAGGIFTSAGGVGAGNVAQWVEPPQTNQLRITLTPLNPPIVVPAQGGSFNFNAAVVRLVGPQTPYSVWARIKNPNGTYTAPVLGPVTINTPVNVTITRQRTQTVPGTWAAGQYSCLGYVNPTFAYPAMDSSSFTFTKSVVADGSPSVWEATCSGEPFPGEMTVANPTTFNLLTVYPNPFNPTTTISFSLPEASHVVLSLYDVSGRQVAQLVNGMRESGTHEVTFDGSALASGVYLCRLQAGEVNTVLKVALMK